MLFNFQHKFLALWFESWGLSRHLFRVFSMHLLVAMLTYARLATLCLEYELVTGVPLRVRQVPHEPWSISSRHGVDIRPHGGQTFSCATRNPLDSQKGMRCFGGDATHGVGDFCLLALLGCRNPGPCCCRLSVTVPARFSCLSMVSYLFGRSRSERMTALHVFPSR